MTTWCWEPQTPGSAKKHWKLHWSCASVPIATHKTEGPGTTIIFLGIELDTVAMEIRLPREKLQRLQQEIRQWQAQVSCMKKELQSLIGQLQNACCVVKPGRSFLRRMIDLSMTVRAPQFRIRLNKGFRSDLQWWACFLPTWNPFREGIDLFLGQTATDICPVKAMLNYLVVRGKRKGPLFMFSNGVLLTRQRLVDALRQALEKAGRPQFSHWSSDNGMEDSVIKTLGRWKSLAYLDYVQIPREQLASYSSLLCS